MADKEQYNDEYQFADLDTIGPEPMDEGAASSEELSKTEDQHKFAAVSTPIKRNAAIVVVAVILIMIIYKFWGSHFSERRHTEKASPTVMTPQPIQSMPPIQQAQPVIPPPTVGTDPKIAQKLSALDISQQGMRSEVASINNQLGGINSNVSALSAQIAELNQTISALSAKVNQQSQEIERLTVKRQPKPVLRRARKVIHFPRYYIQAVIPGRAWLIAKNGATLTVREGTVIPGYGIVKLIDPNQGRITTSSGQVIKFSQEDS